MKKYAVKELDKLIYGLKINRSRSTGEIRDYYEKLLYAHRRHKRTLLAVGN
jgi:hypothetical protein